MAADLLSTAIGDYISDFAYIGSCRKTYGKAVRVDYKKNASAFIETFEGINGRVLRTSFNYLGEILDQEIIDTNDDAEALVDRFVSNFGMEKKTVQYYDVNIRKKCPKCGAYALSRSRAGFPSKIDVMPMYTCESCGNRFYDITNEYLLKLVKSNRNLFEQQEISIFDKEPETFLNELKGYIIRIFASKKIMEIQ
jgi:hypothetical protein